MSKRNSRSPWLYGGIIILLLIFIGAYTVPIVAQLARDRQSPAAITQTASTVSLPANQGKLTALAEGYEQVLQREPNNLTALQGLVEVRLEQGQLQDALLPLERLANLVPEQPDYAILLGQARQHFGDLDGALTAYESVLNTYPGYIKALQSVVSLQLQQDRPEWAIGLLQTTLKTAAQANEAQPGSIDVMSVQMLLGRVYEYQERYTEAIAVYDQITAQNKNDFRPLWAKADILREQGRSDSARVLYDRALALAPPRYKDAIKQLLTQAQTAAESTEKEPASTAEPEVTTDIEGEIQ